MKNIISLKVLICYTLVTSSTLFTAHAQEKGIYELNSAQTELSRTHFYDLVFNLHPTIYISNNKITKVRDEKKLPMKININGSNSFNKLNNLGIDKSRVELIYITLQNPNQLNTVLDLTNSMGMTSLKYVYIKCYFDCNGDSIEKFIKFNSETVRVFYKSEIPS